MNPMTSSPIRDEVYLSQNESILLKNLSCYYNYDSANSNYLFGFMVKGVLMNAIGIFGIIGNAISMTILSRPKMKSSINCFLIGLGFCDTVLIITISLLYGIPAIYPYTGYLFKYNFWLLPSLAPVIAPIGQIAQASSVNMTLAVTIERLVAVCFPLKAKSLCTYGNTKKIVIVLLVGSTLLHIPRFMSLTCVEYIHQNFTVYCIKSDSVIKYSPLVIISIRLLTVYFLPFIALAILNGCIYWQVRKANITRQSLTSMQKNEINLATMLLCVIAVFFVCYVVTAIIGLLSLYGYANSYLVDTIEVFLTINGSVNFIIYVAYGENFKKCFQEVFCSKSESKTIPLWKHAMESIRDMARKK